MGEPVPAPVPAVARPLVVAEDLAVHFPIKRGVVFDRTVGHVRAVDGVSVRIGPAHLKLIK